MDKKNQNNVITIAFDKDNEINLNSDNPDLNVFVTKVIELKDSCNFELIEITTANEDFDKKGFKDIVLKSINSFLKDIEINEEQLEQALKSIKETKEKN